MGAKVFGMIRTRPRVFDQTSDSERERLHDRVWLKREEDVDESDAGTPVTRSVEFGPYRGRLSTPEALEQRQTDHYVQETTHRAVVEMDEEPESFDRLRVRRRAKGEDEIFRITRVRDRTPVWGGTFLYHFELAKTTEY